MDIAMAVSRTLSFVVGLSLPGLIAFAAIGEDIQAKQDLTTIAGSAVNTTHIVGSPPAVWKCKDELSEQKLEDYLERCTRSKACDINLAKKTCETESLPPSPETVQLRDLAARLYRLETVLREMCAEMAVFTVCGGLWQQK